MLSSKQLGLKLGQKTTGVLGGSDSTLFFYFGSPTSNYESDREVEVSTSNLPGTTKCMAYNLAYLVEGNVAT